MFVSKFKWLIDPFQATTLTLGVNRDLVEHAWSKEVEKIPYEFDVFGW